MNAPIRSTATLAIAARNAQLERELSDSTVEDIAGLASGSLPKYLAPNPPKNLGLVSTFLILGALGKALVIVDDPEQIERVKGRWKRRNIVGGSAMQLRDLAEKQGSEPSLSTSLSIGDQMRGIRKMVKRENLVKAGKAGAKRRMRTMDKRARQRVASHAARIRWAKKSLPTP